MHTRCPNCQTIFRVTTEQLRARAGKVRCGECRTAFSALDTLLEAGETVPIPAAADAPRHREEVHQADVGPALEPTINPEVAAASETARPPAADSATDATLATAEQAAATPDQPEETDRPIPPHETRETPRSQRWLEGLLSKPVLPPGSSLTRPYAIVAALLTLTLAGQLVFHFRSTIAVATPSLRPALEALSDVLGSEMPLPRQVELVSIETSDLQSDPGRNRLLALRATLRNRATYAQAYPALEITLTDTSDKAIARRVFQPDDYLSAAELEEKTFAANADLEVRLWLEAREINAAGYRLYVFYP